MQWHRVTEIEITQNVLEKFVQNFASERKIDRKRGMPSFASSACLERGMPSYAKIRNGENRYWSEIWRHEPWKSSPR